MSLCFSVSLSFCGFLSVWNSYNLRTHLNTLELFLFYTRTLSLSLSLSLVAWPSPRSGDLVWIEQCDYWHVYVGSTHSTERSCSHERRYLLSLSLFSLWCVCVYVCVCPVQVYISSTSVSFFLSLSLSLSFCLSLLCLRVLP
jgi:hypothetical protein